MDEGPINRIARSLQVLLSTITFDNLLIHICIDLHTLCSILRHRSRNKSDLILFIGAVHFNVTISLDDYLFFIINS